MPGGNGYWGYRETRSGGKEGRGASCTRGEVDLDRFRELRTPLTVTTTEFSIVSVDYIQ